MKTRKCTKADQDGRAKKARKFLEAAEIVAVLADDDADLLDATITLWVHAGIAAADALCCGRLGEHAQGQSHVEAADLLAKVDKALAGDLRTLLAMKTRAGYGSAPSTAKTAKVASRAATHLVDALATL